MNLRLLKTCRIFSVIGIISSFGVIWNTYDYVIWIIVLFCAVALTIVSVVLTIEISKIKSSKRVIRILDNLLQEMEDEGVAKLSDLKRNKK